MNFVWLLSALLFAPLIYAGYMMSSAVQAALFSKRLIFQSVRNLQKFHRLEASFHVALFAFFCVYAIFNIRSLFTFRYIETVIFGFACVLPLICFSKLNGKAWIVLGHKLAFLRKNTPAFMQKYPVSADLIDSVLGSEWKTSGELRRIIGVTLAPFVSLKSELGLAKLRIVTYAALLVHFMCFGFSGGPVKLFWGFTRDYLWLLLRIGISGLFAWLFKWIVLPKIMGFLWEIRQGESAEEKKKHVVLVTGGSKGIGKELARMAVKEGFGSVVLVARDIKRLEEARSDLSKKYDGQIDIISADLTTAEGRQKVFDVVAEVDVLVNNAGVGRTALLHQTEPPESVETVVLLNDLALVAMTRRYLPGMIKRKYGRILNVSSVVGGNPFYGQAVYSASKAFVDRFTDLLRMEVDKSDNVFISNLAPGMTRSEFANHAFQIDATPQELARGLRKLKGWRADEPDVVAEIGWRGLFQNVPKTISGSAMNSLLAEALPAKAVKFLTRKMVTKMQAQIDAVIDELRGQRKPKVVAGQTPKEEEVVVHEEEDEGLRRRGPEEIAESESFEILDGPTSTGDVMLDHALSRVMRVKDSPADFEEEEGEN